MWGNRDIEIKLFERDQKISIEIENFDRDQMFLIVGSSGNLLPRKAKKTLRGKNILENVGFMLVLMGIFGGSLKITLQNGNNPKG